MAKHDFPLTGTIPHLARAGDSFYLTGLILGFLLWSFAVVWFIVAIIMISTAYPFPFNMGWWGFIFPVGKSRFYQSSGHEHGLISRTGVFTPLTISIGEEFGFKFFKILSCVSKHCRNGPATEARRGAHHHDETRLVPFRRQYRCSDHHDNGNSALSDIQY